MKTIGFETVLITGGVGFVGNHHVGTLIAREATLYVLDNLAVRPLQDARQRC